MNLTVIQFLIYALVAFNEDLKAVHYSMVNAGIDENITARKLNFIQNTSINDLGSLPYDCDGCQLNTEGDNVVIKTNTDQTSR